MPPLSYGAPHSTVERLVLRRDPTTLLLCALLAVWGFFNFGFGSVVALLREEQGISRGLASLHGTAFAAGAVVGGILTPWLAAARSSYAMAIAFGVAPFVLGAVVDATSIRLAFFLVPRCWRSPPPWSGGSGSGN